MCKKNISVLAILLMFVLLFLFTSCDNTIDFISSENQTNIESASHISSVSLDNSYSSKDIELIIPEYLELPNIGDTYQLEPECRGVKEPIYSYVSGAPEIVSVDANGLITVHGHALVKIYVVVTDGETGNALAKEILVVAGDVKVPGNSEQL